MEQKDHASAEYLMREHIRKVRESALKNVEGE